MSTARAIADLTEGTILASVDIAAPPERVFAAITDGAEIVKWWGSPDTYQTTSWTTDLRVGGKWRAEGRGRDGHSFHVEGEFREIDPPRRLVHTWQPQWDSEATTVTYMLMPIEGGTRVTVSHKGFGGRPEACDNHKDGWMQVLGWLAGHLASTSDSALYFFCQLVPPRPDFALTLTPEERAVMGQHSAYLRRNMAEGRVVTFGPVNDPNGSWGLGIIRVNSEAELRDMLANDPAVLSGRGLAYRTTPMFTAVWREP